MITQVPNSSEVEVTLIGTGGGYGESVVLKIGIDKWIVIDSCFNPTTKEPLALNYLNKVNADLDKVVLIVCTHWHNDHIRGLSKILECCPNAEFCFSQVTDLRKFLYLCELDYTKSLKGTKISTGEFAQCLEILDKRETCFIQAKSNSLLANINENDCRFELFALSPSDKTVHNFTGEISQLITDFGKRNTAIMKKTPNDKSVVLLLKFNDERVLLGADLEVGDSDEEGWRHIVNHSKVKDEHKANLYKISHHGSENGYHEDIFNILVNDNSVLKLTPFKGRKLPSDEMIKIYSSHSDQVYSTSSVNVSKKPKKRDKSLEKIIERTVKSISEIKFNHGIVRSRLDYSNNQSTWNTEIFDAGQKLT